MKNLNFILLFLLGVCFENTIEAVTTCYVGSGDNVLTNSTISEIEPYNCGALDVPFCQTIVTTNLITSITTFLQSCATSCFDGRIDDGKMVKVTSCCTSENCNYYTVSFIKTPYIESCYIGLGNNLGNLAVSYPSQIYSCGVTQSRFCITFITTNRDRGEITYRQACAKNCIPDFVIDPVTNASVQTTCCSLPNCNYFDSSSFTTTTRRPTSSLSCYVGVGPNVSGIPSNSQIVLCLYPLNNYCSLSISTNRITSATSYSQSCSQICNPGTTLDSSGNIQTIISCCTTSNCNSYQNATIINTTPPIKSYSNVNCFYNSLYIFLILNLLF